MQTTKQKIDDLLGIKEGGTIDDFLNDLQMETDQVSATLSTLNNGMKQTVEDIDKSITSLSCNVGENSVLTMSQVDNSLGELRDLIDISKKVIMHVYESVITTDLVDSELIGAMAKLIEATHINIADYIDLYKQRVAYYDKLKIMNYQQQQKIELMRLKHELDMKKLEGKNVTATPENMMSYTYEDISKMVDDAAEVDVS